jgi:LCP family protein required for cell wall assembly
MSEWPEGWFRDGGANQPAGPGGAGDPTVRAPRPGLGRLPDGQASASGYGPGGASGYGPGGRLGSGSTWPEQPPARTPGRRGAPPGRSTPAGPGRPGGGPGRRWLRPRRILVALVAVVALVLVASVGTYYYVSSKLTHSDVLVDYSGRPAAGAGTNWLITGSDSRQGLTRKQERQLATGKLSAISGQRSDTILILHIPSNGGRAVLVSIPRDSYVNIPGYGMNKINAAYDLGGPKLLAETVQNATGLYINHYMGIGFGGFVRVVDDVGGVRMCLPGPMVDPKAGLNLKAGCQTLDGAQALGYVRTRNFNISDLQREQDQRLFLRALLSKLTSTGTLVNPFASVPAATGTASALTVSDGTNLTDLWHAAFAFRNPETTTVPIATADYQTPNAGVAVLWDRAQATRLFNALKNDTPVPPRLLTGSKAAGTLTS